MTNHSRKFFSAFPEEYQSSFITWFVFFWSF